MMFAFIEAHPPALVVFVLSSAFLMPTVAHFNKKWCGPVASFLMAVAFACSLHLAKVAGSGTVISYSAEGWPPPWGIEVLINYFSAFMLVIITFLCLVVLVYSLSAVWTEVAENAIGWYYTTILLTTAAMIGMAITNDVFNMYVFIEVTGISACALVLARNSKMATEAAFKYLLLATVGSGFVLFAITLLYLITGNLNIPYVAMEFQKSYSEYPFLIWSILSFFLVGFGIKSALFPLHLWLPDAYSSAPSVSSAFLSGLVGKAYIVALIKFFYLIFGFDLLNALYIRHLMLIMASIAIIAGSLFAFSQVDIKRRLAYSSVSQIGYIFLGIGLGSPLGFAAAILHIFNHSIMKACLFMATGAVYYQTGERRVNRLSGLGYEMPITFGAFTIVAMSMMSLPLFSGFISKWYLAKGSIEAGIPVLVGLLVLSSLLNATYYLPIIWQAFFDVDRERPKTFKLDRIPVSMAAPIVVLALAVIYFGLQPQLPLYYAEQAAKLFLP